MLTFKAVEECKYLSQQGLRIGNMIISVCVTKWAKHDCWQHFPSSSGFLFSFWIDLVICDVTMLHFNAQKVHLLLDFGFYSASQYNIHRHLIIISLIGGIYNNVMTHYRFSLMCFQNNRQPRISSE